MKSKLENARKILGTFVEALDDIESAKKDLHLAMVETAKADLTEEDDDVRENRELQEFEEAVVLLIMQRKASIGKNKCDELIGALKRIRRPRKE